MPEHCHVLLYPKNEEYEMGEILTKIKSPAAKAILAARPRAATAGSRLTDLGDRPNIVSGKRAVVMTEMFLPPRLPGA